MKRGYFDDFKDLKETQGRIFQPSEQLSPAGTSPHLPPLAVCSFQSFKLQLKILQSQISKMLLLLLCMRLDPCQAMVHQLTRCDMMQVMEPGGAEVMFPPPQGSLRVALLCIAFRAGAEACTFPSTATWNNEHQAQSIRQLQMATECCETMLSGI